MIISAVWIIGWCTVKALWGLFSSSTFGLTVYEIIISGAAITTVFTPVYVSIMRDKMREFKQ